MTTERESAMMEAALKLEELRFEGHELYGWLRRQARGEAASLVWMEMTHRRRRDLPPSTLDYTAIRSRTDAMRTLLTPHNCGEPECDYSPEPAVVSHESVYALLGDIEVLSTEIARLRLSESRAHEATEAQERYTDHVQGRVLEFFRRCITPNIDRGVRELRIGGITQFAVAESIVKVSRGDAIGHTLFRWWRELVTPHEFPDNHQLPR